MKHRLPALLLILLLLCACASADTLRLEGEGFDTPEAAVTRYLEGLRDLDFERMLSAFAWETQAERCDLKARILYTRSIFPAMIPKYPSDSAFLRQINMEQLRAQQINLISLAFQRYVLGDEVVLGGKGYDYTYVTIAPVDEAMAEEYLALYTAGRVEALAGLSGIRFLTPDEVTGGLYSSEQNAKSRARQHAAYGADEVIDLPAVADVGERLLFCCPTVARYGERWYLVSATGIVPALLSFEQNRQAFVVVDSPADLFR